MPHVLDLQQLDGQTILQWMDGPPSTHILIDGVTLTREQLVEFVRLGRTDGATAQARYLDQIRQSA